MGNIAGVASRLACRTRHDFLDVGDRHCGNGHEVFYLFSSSNGRGKDAGELQGGPVRHPRGVAKTFHWLAYLFANLIGCLRPSKAPINTNFPGLSFY